LNRRIDIPVRPRFNAGSDSAVNGIPEAKFPKSAHLLKHADFQRVYEKGKRHFSGNVTVFFWRRETPAQVLKVGVDTPEVSKVAGDRSPVLGAVNLPGPRVGFTVGRVLGGSVERNRIRRRTREAVRQYYSRYCDMPVDIVIHPKKTVLKVDFAELMSEIERAFQVVQQRTSQAGVTCPSHDQPLPAARSRQKDRSAKSKSRQGSPGGPKHL
jgi:ribonuclease P protein component